MTTTENNKLLAEFMGCYQNNEGFWGFENTPNHKRWHTDRFLDCTKYDTDWSWLMEVVEKIENLNFEVIIRGCSVTVVSNTDKHPYFQPHSVELTKKESIYDACVTFIKWYNKTLKKTRKI